MLVKLAGFTLAVAGVTVLQLWLWMKRKPRRERVVFLGGMALAWAVGVMFLAGFRLPEPQAQLFPWWK